MAKEIFKVSNFDVILTGSPDEGIHALCWDDDGWYPWDDLTYGNADKSGAFMIKFYGEEHRWYFSIMNDAEEEGYVRWVGISEIHPDIYLYKFTQEFYDQYVWSTEELSDEEERRLKNA